MPERGDSQKTLREVLARFSAQPSRDFYARMQDAPWLDAASTSTVEDSRRHLRGLRRRKAVLSLRWVAAVAAAAVLLLVGVFVSVPGARAAFGEWLNIWHPIGRPAPTEVYVGRSTSTDAKDFVGVYDTAGPAADAAEMTNVMVLHADGSIRITAKYSGQPEIIESGTWRVESPGRIVTSLREQRRNGQVRTFEVVETERYELHGDVLIPLVSDDGSDVRLLGGLRFWRR